MALYGDSTVRNRLPSPRLVLDDGRPRFGAWSGFRDPAVVDVLAAEGFDWICFDAQHGGAEVSEIKELIEAAHAFSVPTMVRVPGHDLGTATRVLDAGAGGLIFPTIDDGATAAALVAACRFPPRGRRSFGPTRRSPRYPSPVPGNAEDDALCLLMVETAEGVANLDAILAAKPDGIFVGPFDLSLNLGLPFEDLTTGTGTAILADIAERCHAAGVVPGIYAGEPLLAQRMLSLGFRFMPVASDGGLLAGAARDAVSAARRPGKAAAPVAARGPLDV
ncbi:HpcH/HpaI aldolase family protein [Sinomonas atrocyanea]|uniref:HpcH/HpaI aldolase family protein n=1 Tax=Sinomonas atrocyanea TaxID=37927 RepID=UPI003D99A26C